MRHWLFVLALLSSPAFAQSGQLTLSPATVSVDNGKQSTEILLTYRAGANATDMESEISLNLDRHGWAEVQVVPSPTPDYINFCGVMAGKVRAFVASRTLGSLPAGVDIPLCRLRVRTHAHTSRGFSWMSVVTAYEVWHGQIDYPVASNNVLVYVP